MTEVVKGRVQAFSDKDEKDWFGVCIDDVWYNGDNSLDRNLQGAVVELTVDPDAEFKNIRKINVIEEEDNEDDITNSREGSDAGTGGESSDSGGKTSSSSTMSSRQANILATASTKKAADVVDKDGKSEGEYIDQVSTVATGLNNVMKKLYEENME